MLGTRANQKIKKPTNWKKIIEKVVFISNFLIAWQLSKAASYFCESKEQQQMPNTTHYWEAKFETKG